MPLLHYTPRCLFRRAQIFGLEWLRTPTRPYDGVSVRWIRIDVVSYVQVKWHSDISRRCYPNREPQHQPIRSLLQVGHNIPRFPAPNLATLIVHGMLPSKKLGDGPKRLDTDRTSIPAYEIRPELCRNRG